MKFAETFLMKKLQIRKLYEKILLCWNFRWVKYKPIEKNKKVPLLENKYRVFELHVSSNARVTLVTQGLWSASLLSERTSC